jgi:hypothetical protein
MSIDYALAFGRSSDGHGHPRSHGGRDVRLRRAGTTDLGAPAISNALAERIAAPCRRPR